MKTIITATALVLALSSTAAFASTTSTIVGNSGAFATECTFVSASNGAMDREDAKWVTTTRGSFNVQIRGAITSLEVESDNILRNSSGNPTGITATADYTQGNGGLRSGATSPTGAVAVTAGKIAVTGITDNGSRNLFQLFVGGSATMSKANGADPLLNLVGNTEYKINHTVTCTQ
tara:strand:- start:1185 stop:1712 length:528 start_codon:yes stop_codon:yes gene_type:complete